MNLWDYVEDDNGQRQLQLMGNPEPVALPMQQQPAPIIEDTPSLFNPQPIPDWTPDSDVADTFVGTSNSNPPPMGGEFEYISPKKALWAATLMNIGNLMGGQQPSVNPISIMQQAQQYNNALKQKQMAAQQKSARGVTMPSIVREYEYAKSQGYEGTLPEYKQIGVRRDPAQFKLAQILADPNTPQNVKDYMMAQFTEQSEVGGLPGEYNPLAENAFTPFEITPDMQGQQDAMAEADAQRQANAAKQQQLAQDAAKKAAENFELVPKIRGSISTYQDAIRTLDEGAWSGWYAQALPTIQSASIELQNVRERAGLNVIGQTSFGALSAPELKLATEVDIPNLPPQDLRPYLARKIAAQEKLADELLKAGIYLSKPGNTVASWYEMNEPRQQVETSGATSLDDFIIKGK